jgi:hypothetical protein
MFLAVGTLRPAVRIKRMASSNERNQARNYFKPECVIGMFSTSQIDKLLGYNVTSEVHPAHSLAALVEQIT